MTRATRPENHEHILRWQARWDKDRARYWERKLKVGNRNIGPFSARVDCIDFRAFFVCGDRWLAAGSTVNGAPVPAGSKLANYPLTGPIASHGQAKKALRKARRRHPEAGIWTLARDTPVLKEEARSTLPKLVLPEGKASEGKA